MKLLYITQSFDIGASGNFSRNLVKKFLENGIEVDVLTIPRFKEKLIYSDKFNLYSVPAYGKHAFFKFEFPVIGLTKLLDLVKKNDYDIIHSQELFPGFLGHIAKMKTRRPHILVKEMASNYPTLHGKTVIFFEKNFITKLNYDKLVSWSKFMIENFFINWGVPKKNIKMIPGGIDLNEMPRNLDVRKIREHYDVCNENLIVVTKPLYKTNTYGIFFIILAMRHILEEIPNTKLLIAGNGEGKLYLENLVKKMKISENVVFLGYLSHMEALKLQKIADVLPHSFMYEPTTSITILESMSSGKPIVCSNSGEANYVLKNCGILVKPRNSKSMAEGIKKVLTDKYLGKTLAKRAFQKVKNKYTIEKVANEYINLYLSLQ